MDLEKIPNLSVIRMRRRSVTVWTVLSIHRQGRDQRMLANVLLMLRFEPTRSPYHSLISWRDIRDKALEQLRPLESVQKGGNTDHGR
jgi:hypothetical protein